jgi:hypothetical protein
MSSKMIAGDILTLVAMLALSLWEVFSRAPDGRTKNLYLATYLVFILFIIIKSLLRRRLFMLKERFFLLLVIAWAALVSFIQVSMNLWNEKPLLRSLIVSASWLALAAYQFFIFSSKDLRETA